jgi:magnesium transporter
MTEIVEGLGAAERERIGALRREQQFVWIDLDLSEASRGDLGELLDLPERILQSLLDFGQRAPPSRTYRADSHHVVFGMACYVGADLRPIDLHVLVSGDYVLTLHEESVSLPSLLTPVLPEERGKQYVVYTILESIVVTAFDALYEAELELESLAVIPTNMRTGRVRMATLRMLSSRLSEMRHRISPERGVFDRIAVEIERIERFGTDDQRYLELIVGQLNRLVDSIDAAADALAQLINLRLNETTYWLTVVATIFLPLTFVTGFFGMNFGWMVREINTQLAFWLLGVGSLLVGVALIWSLVVRGSPVQPDES